MPPQTRARAAVSALGAAITAFCLGILACVAATWPAALTANTHTVVPLGYADVQAGLWWPRHVGEAVLGLHNPFWAPELFWPHGQDVTLLTWNVLAELVLCPLWLIFPAHAALNAAAFVVAGLNAVAMSAAARRLTTSRVAPLAAAALAGVSHFAFIEMVNGRIEQALWAPVALVVAELVAPDPRPIRAGVWLGLAASIYWFYGYFLVIILCGWWLWHRSAAAARFVLQSGAVSALVALPAFLPVALAALSGAPARAAADTFSSQAAASVPLPQGLFWPLGVDPAFSAMAVPCFVLPAAVLALWRGGRLRILGALSLVTLLFALGPYAVGPGGVPVAGVHLWLPTSLLDVLPGMSRFWWVYRWLTLTIPASLLTMVVLWERRPAVLLALVLGSGFETASLLRGGHPSAPLPRQGVRTPPALAALPGPVLVLPKGDVRRIFVGWQAWFHQPTDLGLGGHLPGVAPQGLLEAAAATRFGRALVDPSSAGTAPWTTGDTGGFRSVLLFFGEVAPGSRQHDAESGALEAKLRTLLGPPAAQNDVGAWWRVADSPKEEKDRGDSPGP